MSAIVKIKYEEHEYVFDSYGWINATEAANRYGKEPYGWLSQRENVEYLVALVEVQGHSDLVKEFNRIKKLDSIFALSQSKLLKIAKKTGFVRAKSGLPENGGGIWLHPKLVVVFARWLDIKFAVWCDIQIDHLIRTNQAPTSIQDMMRLMLLPKATVWEKRFPDSFYKALAKVTGTKFNSHIGGTPAIFGELTNKWIYGVILPEEVLSELRANKRDGEKMHQWLTSGGEKLLSDQINKVEAIANSSTDYPDFISRCLLAFSKVKGQLKLVMPQNDYYLDKAYM
ncbi:P63C domain-containing protein [Acinetobacter pittii]|uniref:P63C domain-containing protein n=1 Tax=Acinetobacter pittii TaxID=48296 RepID=UPI002DBF1D71|nr:P63C domain-containing protein [Acinetobacter pittii]MEB7642067.1 P63C domain-containing protein [Acinetobacter pittii]